MSVFVSATVSPSSSAIAAIFAKTSGARSSGKSSLRIRDLDHAVI